MIEIWENKNGKLGIVTSSTGSPAWNHWCKILRFKDCKWKRIELDDMESAETKDHKWKLKVKFIGLDYKETK